MPASLVLAAEPSLKLLFGGIFLTVSGDKKETPFPPNPLLGSKTQVLFAPSRSLIRRIPCSSPDLRSPISRSSKIEAKPDLKLRLKDLNLQRVIEFGVDEGLAAKVVAPKFNTFVNHVTSHLGIVLPAVEMKHVIATTLVLKGLRGWISFIPTSIAAIAAAFSAQTLKALLAPRSSWTANGVRVARVLAAVCHISTPLNSSHAGLNRSGSTTLVTLPWLQYKRPESALSSRCFSSFLLIRYNASWTGLVNCGFFWHVCLIELL
ncbi:hypothetical protein Cni_G13622 [Canna indica]|uniref:Uncharacterized protein n=1 Tax=Canna indica TaxID=4628 RepID=A0AAQ3KA79_9LILI|nr:hypothetical protein Cni_G13622 [Canna indica]